MASEKRVIAKSETFCMSQDRSIAVDVFLTGADGVRGEAHASIRVGEALHADLLKRFPDLKPGDDSITIDSQMIIDDDDDGDNPTLEELARWQIDKARHLAIGLAMVGRRVESAVMIDTGSLMMSSQGAMDSGQITNANWDVRPGDPQYAAICKRFNLQKPGDMHSIEYRLVDNKWLNVSTDRFEEPY